MIVEPKTILLKNNQSISLRSPHIKDSEKILEFVKKIYQETDFLARNPEEFSLSVEEEEKYLENLTNHPDNTMILCEMNQQIIGNCQVSRLTHQKMAHRCQIGIAVLKDFWGLGIGSVLMNEMIAFAKKKAYRQMELAYIEGNQRAKSLYERKGFREVARIPEAIKTKQNTYVAEIIMQLSLTQTEE